MNIPEWQRQRALKLDQVCQWIEAQIAEHGKMTAIAKAAEQFNGLELPNGDGGKKRLRLSPNSAYRLHALWLAHGRQPNAFRLAYSGPCRRVVPPDLLTDWRRRLTLRGKQSASQIYKELQRDWTNGKSVPGLGAWTDWWAVHHHDQPTPHKAPDFPYSYSTLMKYQPDKVTRALGNFGLIAARESIRHITRDSSQLRPCEVYTLDDKDGDHKVIDDVYGTSGICKPTMYFMMDVGPRYIAGFMVRPTKALAADVDELIAQVLRDHGRGNGYPTHILFERGTTACTAAREEWFNALFPQQLFVHRTGMIQGYAYAGQWREESSGKPCSKGMIEAFNGKLDLLLQALPGKDGRTHLTRATEDLLALEKATGLTLNVPLLHLSQYTAIVRKAVENYNADCRHQMQGFHQIHQLETAPGVWCDLPTVTRGELHAVLR